MVRPTGRLSGVVSGVAFVWLGMVLAISFLEAPLKFRAPGVTVPIGVGIGRIVFRALNTVEAVLAALVVVGLLWFPRAAGAAGVSGVVVSGVVVSGAVAVAVLIGQLLAVRPVLTRRADRVLAGEDTGGRSRIHLVYVALEVVKVVALTVLGVVAS